MNDRHLNVSIVIPVFNEEQVVINTIESIISIMEKTQFNYDIIVVNDGSTDKTKNIISSYIKKGLKNVFFIDHENNLGYGAALKTGIKESNKDIIVITDADGTYPNEKIPLLLNYILEYDMVVGARIGKNVKIPLIRRPAKWMINVLANYLTSYKIPDLNSGLRVMKKKLIKKYINYLPDGFSFTTTITLSLLTNKYKIKYLPIDYMKRKGKSKIRPIRDTLNFIQLIIRTVTYFNPLNIFLPFSLFFFIPGLVFLIRDLINYNIAQTTILMLVSGSIILSIGMLADLINKKM